MTKPYIVKFVPSQKTKGSKKFIQYSVNKEGLDMANELEALLFESHDQGYRVISINDKFKTSTTTGGLEHEGYMVFLEKIE